MGFKKNLIAISFASTLYSSKIYTWDSCPSVVYSIITYDKFTVCKLFPASCDEPLKQSCFFFLKTKRRLENESPIYLNFERIGWNQ